MAFINIRISFLCRTIGPIVFSNRMYCFDNKEKFLRWFVSVHTDIQQTAQEIVQNLVTIACAAV